jgi:hypothetical protein
MKLLSKLGGLFKSDKGSKLIDKGMDLTATNLKHRKIFKISVLVILAILLLAGAIEGDVFIDLVNPVLK